MIKIKTFLRELCEYHVSGQLKVAPEHISNAVLSRLGKPSVEVYNSFVKAYKDMNKKIGKEQYLVPYLMSSHPGSTLKEAIELAEYLRDLGYMPEQCRISIRHRLPSLHACTIQDLTRQHLSRCMSQLTHMRRLCRGRSSSTAIQRTMISCTRHL